MVLFGVLVEFCWGLFCFLWLGTILIGVLCEYGVLDDILFICIGFIRVGVELDN